MAIATKVAALFSIGPDAKTKVTAATFVTRAKIKLKELIGYELFTKYTQGTQPTADTVSSVTKSAQTIITMAADHYRRDDCYVLLQGFVDDGLWVLNGRHKITYISDSSFYVDIDTTYADNYTSGGTVIDAVWDELETAEAYIIMYFALPSLIDVKDGDVGVVLTLYKQYGDGSATPSPIEAIEKLQLIFFNNAIEIINTNIDGGDNFETQIIAL